MTNDPETKGSGENNCPRFSFVRMLLFGFLVLIGNAPFWFFPEPTIPFQRFMVKIVGGLIQASGLQVVYSDLYITLKSGEWVMTAECTALSAMIVFVAFVLAYPSALKSKGIAIVAGIPFLILANTLRLFSLAWATEMFPKYAEFVHDYVWQVAFLIVIAVMWLLWIEMVVRHENKAAVSG
jgi:exosortase/archaeosortase family protein